MTKHEVLDSISEFSEKFPKEAVREIQANRDCYIPELLNSLDYAYHNAEELSDGDSDYFMHTYAMYLLAEFREKRAFPLLINLLRLPEDESEFILGDSLTQDFYRMLLCTFDSENIQMLLDVIENTELYEWARSAAVSAYELLIEEGVVSKAEGVSYLRKLIYNKLPSDDSYIVFTEIVGLVIDAGLIDMIPDVRFLYENDRVDEFVYGKYDSFIDWLFKEEPSRPHFIDDAVSEMEWWHCFKRESDNDSRRDRLNTDNFNYMFGELKKNIMDATGGKPKKIGRNDPCPCGSGKKYKKCCLDAQQNGSTVADLEDKYDLMDMYPQNSALFDQKYEKEAIDIDTLVYKALHHRSIPVWKKRDMKQERIGKIDYLNEALALFSDKCRREQITSFSAYDERFMIHYRSVEWVSALINLIEVNDPERLITIRQTAEDVFQKFS